MIAGVTDGRLNIDAHNTSKFLFYHFNNLRCDLGEEAYKVRHTIVSENKHARESLQSKEWSCHISLIVC